MARRTTKGKYPKVKRLPPGTPSPIDIHVGKMLRRRRTLMGFSQERLGAAVGLTFQQIQKYERGANRMGASRLYEFAQILEIPITYFFDEMPTEIKRSGVAKVRELAEQDQEPLEADPLSRRESLELIRAYYGIADPQVRKRILELTRSLATYLPDDED